MRWKPALLLAVATLAVLGSALRGGFVYDDQVLIARNPALLGSDFGAMLTSPMFGGATGYWRPLTTLLLWSGYAIGGATGIHALALLLHVANALLVRDLAERLLGDPRPAFWTALLFAVHPVQVESVAWCAAINDPLWGLFALLALRSAVRRRGSGPRGLPWAAAAFALAALLAKENGIVALPLAWAVAAERHTLRPFALATALVVTAWWLLRLAALRDTAALLPGGEPGLGIAGLRAASAPAELLLRHLLAIAWPWPLSPLRPFALDVGSTTALAWMLGAIAVAGALSWLSWSLPRTRAAAALLVLPLLPTLARFSAIGAHPIGDRYLYLSVSGAALLVAATPVGRRPWLAAPLAAALAVLAFAQVGVYRDQAAFVAHCRAHAAEDPVVLVMSGNLALLAEPRDLARADAEFALAERHAEATAGGHPLRVLADARLGRAWCLFFATQGSRSSAAQLVAAFQRAVQADDRNAAAWSGLGVAYGATGNAVEGERALRRSLALDPASTETWANLRNLYRLTGNTAGMRECEAHLPD